MPCPPLECSPRTDGPLTRGEDLLQGLAEHGLIDARGGQRPPYCDYEADGQEGVAGRLAESPPAAPRQSAAPAGRADRRQLEKAAQSEWPGFSCARTLGEASPAAAEGAAELSAVPCLPFGPVGAGRAASM